MFYVSVGVELIFSVVRLQSICCVVSAAAAASAVLLRWRPLQRRRISQSMLAAASASDVSVAISFEMR